MKILVIDDEFVALTKMTAMLSNYGDCEAATNGEQALDMYFKAIYNAEPYGLITIDIDMPGLSGIELLKKICEREKRMNVTPARRIMVSAASDQKNVIEAARNNCGAFLVKPVKRDTLIEKLKAMQIEPLKKVEPA